MDKVIRVAQVIGMATNGGVESFVMNYYNHIDKNKVQFDFLVENTSKIINKEKIESLGGKIIIIPSYKNIFKYTKTLKEIFKEGNYDIVHSNMNALSVFSLYAAKKAEIKVRIAHSHSTSNKKEHIRNLIKNVLRLFSKKYATDYFACSELAGRWLFGDKAYDKGLVTIINNAIDLEKYKFNEETRNKIRIQYGLSNQYVIGHIGRFVSQKNHTFLIDIFNDVQKRRRDAKLLLLGDGPLYDEIVNKVKRLNLEDKVIFAGVKQNASDYYNAMDVFVLPSLYEGLGMVLIEAQTNGLSCVASTQVPKEANIVNCIEFLNLTSSTEEWAHKITEINNVVNRSSCFSKIKQTGFDIVIETKKLENIYLKLLRNKGVNQIL